MLYLKGTVQHSEKKNFFDGKVAFISGGSRGIGFAIAKEFALKGTHVVFTYLRSRTDADQAQKQLSAFGVRVEPVRANMGNKDQVRKVFERIGNEFGHLDFMIHNAATGDLKPALDLTDEEWERTLEMNLRSLLQCVRLSVPLMAGRRGKIVSISSHGSYRCLPNYAAVGVTKSGIESLSRYLAVELAPKGINVNVVMAGTVETQSLQKIPGHEEMLHVAKARTPAGRIGRPQDIAHVVSFLCSEESRWIVGQTIIADGGYSLLA
ncbi:MAG: SDR family oxidoreductase [Elusimicrobia bacterium]|nr:SDR family oxidoreductase [Elusimicrobiota bacterium]MBI2915508.1 SDR family oxidoreductase [Elusimicrobiota bacterium]MBI3012514.1 SDR family oxidoreductase [Elusimicrobiota bacterium]MBI4217915.1 SDR family oxidoreductase [Elusimicrobiota bacterium]